MGKFSIYTLNLLYQIMINPFVASKSNEIITDLNDPDMIDNLTEVVGLIFETN